MKKCILVGNGKFDKEFGSIIDSYEDVYRFNRFVTNGFEKIVGSKCTHWILNRAIIDSRDFFNKNISKHSKKYPDLKESWVVTQSSLSNDRLKSIKKKYNIFNYHVSEFAINNTKLSTGVLTINFILDKYDEIHLVGFDFGKNNHYWGDSTPSDKPGKHDWESEKRYVDYLIKIGKVKIIV